MKKEYTNDTITVIWEPDKCIHSKLCWKGLNEVFKPNQKPWIDLSGAEADTIVAQIKNCPSGALSYIMNNQENQTNQNMEEKKMNVRVIPGGPLIVDCTVCITHKDGSEETKENRASFCRCGASNNKPYCDGAHKAIEFDV